MKHLSSRPQDPAYSHLGTDRLKNLADGIFAIAMTILVLDLQVPPIKPPFTTEAIWSALTGQRHVFVNYGLSFYILAAIWMSHVSHTRSLEKTHYRHLWMNMFFLLTVGLVPFTTSFCGDYPGVFLPRILFHVNMLLVGITSVAQVLAAKRYLGMPMEFRHALWSSLRMPIAAGLGLPLTLLSPDYSGLIYLVIPLFRPRPPRHTN